ncbi:MAG: hypothetical protein WBL85_10440 [Sedimentisphaerales bacterium]
MEDSVSVTLGPSTFRITFAGLSRKRYAIFSFSSLQFSSLQLFSSLPLFVTSIWHKNQFTYNNIKNLELTSRIVKEAKSSSYTLYRPNTEESFKEIFIDVVLSNAGIVYDGEV